MKSFLMVLFFLGTYAAADAQDKIFMTSGKIIECKIIEVGTEEIKYKVSTEADATVFAVKKIDVLRIEFANGKVEKFRDQLNDPELYKDNKKIAWKLDFIAPVWGSTIFGYERSIRPGLSIEANVGIIGLGYDEYAVKPRGGLIMFGPKFLASPDFLSGSQSYYHVLKGVYLQPQLIVGVYESIINYYTPNSRVTGRETTSYANLMFNFGRQIVYDNAYLVDVYAGIGYGFSTTTTKHRPASIAKSEFIPFTPYYGSINPDLLMPVAVSIGIKLGFLTH